MENAGDCPAFHGRVSTVMKRVTVFSAYVRCGLGSWIYTIDKTYNNHWLPETYNCFFYHHVTPFRRVFSTSIINRIRIYLSEGTLVSRCFPFMRLLPPASHKHQTMVMYGELEASNSNYYPRHYIEVGSPWEISQNFEHEFGLTRQRMTII
jgi:hypothetical protein